MRTRQVKTEPNPSMNGDAPGDDTTDRLARLRTQAEKVTEDNLDRFLRNAGQAVVEGFDQEEVLDLLIEVGRRLGFTRRDLDGLSGRLARAIQGVRQMAAAVAADDGEEVEAKAAVAKQLVDLVVEKHRPGMSEEGDPFVVPLAGPNVVQWINRAHTLRPEVSKDYLGTYGKVPSSSQLTDALTAIEGMARTCEPESTALRVARHQDSLVLDLGQKDGTVAVISPGRWHLTKDSPVLWRRTAAMGPMPEPVKGGSLDGLRALINVGEIPWQQIVGWEIGNLNPDIAHPALRCTGPQGTAKTWSMKMLTRLIDTSPAQVRKCPTNPKDWLAQAVASWVVGMDNVSSFQQWLSDSICRAVTGDGSVDRTLYSNLDVTVVSFRRCIAYTTISTGVPYADLAERTLEAEFHYIEADDRRTDREMQAAFDQVHAEALGALLDLTAQVLLVLPEIRPSQLPRMADFACILAALDKVWGLQEGSTCFENYLDNTTRMLRQVIDDSELAQALLEFLGRKQKWEGQPQQLLEKLTDIATRPRGTHFVSAPLPKDWPHTPRGLTGQLQHLSHALRVVCGVIVTTGKQAGHSPGNRGKVIITKAPGRR